MVKYASRISHLPWGARSSLLVLLWYTSGTGFWNLERYNHDCQAIKKSKVSFIEHYIITQYSNNGTSNQPWCVTTLKNIPGKRRKRLTKLAEWNIYCLLFLFQENPFVSINKILGDSYDVLGYNVFLINH